MPSIYFYRIIKGVPLKLIVYALWMPIAFYIWKKMKKNLKSSSSRILSYAVLFSPGIFPIPYVGYMFVPYFLTLIAAPIFFVASAASSFMNWTSIMALLLCLVPVMVWLVHRLTSKLTIPLVMRIFGLSLIFGVAFAILADNMFMQTNKATMYIAGMDYYRLESILIFGFYGLLVGGVAGLSDKSVEIP